MLKLTGGEFRGRSIETPRSDKTRPTQAKMRQALFNSLQTVIPDARLLDLFAGSGALGLEALSRGAREVVFLESDRTAVQLIHKNLKTLGVAELGSVRSQPLSLEGRDPAASALSGVSGSFDIILADPPYAEGWEPVLLERFEWERWLAPGGIFCVEWGKLKSVPRELPDRSGCLVKVREKIYGDSVLTSYRREALVP